MRLRLGINVLSCEGQFLGRIKYLLINRETLELGGLVIQSRCWLVGTRETLIPINLCLKTFGVEQPVEVRLNLPARQFETLQPYSEYLGDEPDEDPCPTWLHCNPEAFFIYHPPHPYTDLKKIRNCSPELVQFGNSAQVLLKDGGHGRIREFYFGSEAERLVLSSLVAKVTSFSKGVTFPVGWLRKIEDERAILNLDRSELVERLTWPARLATMLEQVKQE
jgi:hypothetical protein